MADLTLSDLVLDHPKAASAPQTALGIGDLVTEGSSEAQPSVPHPENESTSLGIGKGISTPIANIDRYSGAAIKSATGFDTGYQKRYENWKSGSEHPASGIWKGKTPGKGGELIGDIVGTLPADVLSAPLGPFGIGATAGALLSDSKTPAGVGLDTAIGSLTGGIGSKIISGVVGGIGRKNVDAQLLKKEGVLLTPGQLMGGKAKWLEDASSSTNPFIKSAQRRSIETFNTAVVNRALGTIGMKLPKSIKPGHEAISYAGDALDREYNDLASRMTATMDKKAIQDYNVVMGKTMNSLPPELASHFKKTADALLTQYGLGPGSKGVSGRVLKDLDRELGAEARGYAKAFNDYDKQKMGYAFDDLRSAFRSLLERSGTPQQAARLKAVNRGWANLVRVEDASRIAGTDGVFTPAQFQRAVRAGDNSVRRRMFARGNALNQDLSRAAMKVLPSTVPNSGTVDRAVAAGLLGGGGYGAYQYGKDHPFAVAPIVAGIGAYTKPGQALTRGLLANRSGMARTVADKLENPASMGLSPLPDWLRGQVSDQ